jgi:hypothetical protein
MGSRDIDETKAATALFGGHFFDMGRARVGLMQLASIFAGCEGVIREVAREGRNISGWDEGDHPCRCCSTITAQRKYLDF